LLAADAEVMAGDMGDVAGDAEPVRFGVEEFLPDPAALHIRHFPDATHALLRQRLDESPVRLTLTGLFAPRAVYADGYLAGQRGFLQRI
jgi:hypothetical protein